MEVLVPRDGTIADVIAGVQKKANLEDNADIRVYESHGGKIYREFQPDSKIAGINEFVTLYAEKYPEEELSMQEGERTINVFNFDRDVSRPHGVPFKFVMKPVSLTLSLRLPRAHTFQGEIFKQTKERLSKRTGIKGKQFEKIKFAVPQNMYTKVQYLEDGE